MLSFMLSEKKETINKFGGIKEVVDLRLKHSLVKYWNN